MQLIAIGLGGFAGAITRYAVDGWVTGLTRGGYPWGTFVINVSGSLLIGLLFVVGVERSILPAELRGPLLIGFVGSYTTFSTLALESWRLMDDGAWLAATANLAGSVLVGVVAVIIGLVIGRALT
jgi:fluoride exporter